MSKACSLASPSAYKLCPGSALHNGYCRFVLRRMQTGYTERMAAVKRATFHYRLVTDVAKGDNSGRFLLPLVSLRFHCHLRCQLNQVLQVYELLGLRRLHRSDTLCPGWFNGAVHWSHPGNFCYHGDVNAASPA